MRIPLFLFIFALMSPLRAQVGIGTTTPANSSILEISSSLDGLSFGGFMPPRVPTVANRNSIMPTFTDKGLILFVEETDCLQLWNGSAWENIHCLNTSLPTGTFQNFDLSTSWGLSSDVPFFDNGSSGFFGITNSGNGGFSNITSLTNNFLGVSDLDDEGVNGTSGFATLTFNTINTSSALSGMTLSFDYEFFEFDTGDDAFYTVFIDGIPQTEVQLINGLGNLSLNGNAVINIPPGTLSVGLTIRIRQDGAGDYAGFDNFALVPN
ncbi:MAG: hypothetical protein AAF489_02340 [Bacteroidota bacterium]